LSQGAVTVDSKRIKDADSEINIDSNGSILKVGKRRFARIVKK